MARKSKKQSPSRSACGPQKTAEVSDFIRQNFPNLSFEKRDPPSLDQIKIDAELLQIASDLLRSDRERSKKPLTPDALEMLLFEADIKRAMAEIQKNVEDSKKELERAQERLSKDTQEFAKKFALLQYIGHSDYVDLFKDFPLERIIETNFNELPAEIRKLVEEVPDEKDELSDKSKIEGDDAINTTLEEFGGAALGAILNRADVLTQQRPRGRPKKDEGYEPKVQVNLRLDSDVISWVKSKGPDYATRINSIVRVLKEIEDSQPNEPPSP